VSTEPDGILRPGGEAAANVTYSGVTDEAGSTIGAQIAAARALGWNSIELRSVGGAPIAALADEEFDRLLAALAEAEISVCCVDSAIANWARPITGSFDEDLAELKVLERRCAALGTRYVRVMSYPNDGLPEEEWGAQVRERMGVLARRSESAGLVLLHENCAGWAGTSASRMLDLLSSVNSPALRLLFDTGNGVAYGYDSLTLLNGIIGYVKHVQIKDAVGDETSATYTMPGEGDCRVAECLRLLICNGYSGVWSIEPHMSVRPHERQLPGDGSEQFDQFVSYGERLMRLVREDVLSRPDSRER